MITKRIQANYDHLQEILKAFMHHADMTAALTVQVERMIDQLQGGAWRGVGAENFYAEMGDLILPAMRKLESILKFAEDREDSHHPA
ncbi:MAG: WXG100 family type VII secretion target [Anaerolineae bacterium]|nr:WXG100 family type VII secretion target [Anaerolineae bacterium]